MTSDIPECADVLGDTGIVFSKGNVASLQSVLGNELTNPGQAQRLGASAQKRVKSNYSWDSVVEMTLRVYDNVSDRVHHRRIDL